MTASKIGATVTSRRVSILLSELEEELQNTLKLLTQLEIEGLTQDQLESILPSFLLASPLRSEIPKTRAKRASKLHLSYSEPIS